MKNIYKVSLIAIVIISSSCKKEYTCECVGQRTFTYSYGNKPPETTNILETKIFKVSKKSKAVSGCSLFGSELTNTYNSDEPGIHSSALIGCEIK